MQKIKLLFIVVSLENSNGTERAVINLANSFDPHKYDITIMSILQQHKHSFFTINEGIYQSSLGYDCYSPSVMLKVIRALINYFRKNEFEYVISTLVYISMILPFVTSSKIVAWEHVAFAYHGKFIRFIRNTIYKKFDLVVCQTSYDLNKYATILRKVVCIPNIVKVKTEFKRNSDIKQIVVVTRFSPEKGIDLLYEIIQQTYFSDKNHDYRFVIVGDGDMKENFKEKSADLINNGFLVLEDKTPYIEQYYANSDLLILPSLSESFGLVIVEAFLYRLPVIAFKIEGGPSILIKNGSNGFLIEPFIVNDFVEKIKLLMSNRELRTKMGDNAILNAKEFSEKKVNEMWIKNLNGINQNK